MWESGGRGRVGHDEKRLSFVGYSNEANLLGAAFQLYPQISRSIILLRPVQVLEDPAQNNPEGTSVLMLSGSHDPFAHMVSVLERALRKGGHRLRAMP